MRQVEASSANEKAADEFVCEFHAYVEAEVFIPHQVLTMVRWDFFGKKCQVEPTSQKR